MFKKKRTKYKLPFTQGRNIGFKHRSKHRAINFQIIMLLDKYKGTNGLIEFTPDKYKLLFEEVRCLPEIAEIVPEDSQDYAVHRAIEFAIYKLFMAGNLTVANIEKAECIMRHKDIIEEAREGKDYKAAISGNRDLLEVFNLVKTKTYEGNDSMFGVKLSKGKDGSQEAIMVGTGSECISAIRQALRVEVPQIAEKKA